MGLRTSDSGDDSSETMHDQLCCDALLNNEGSHKFGPFRTADDDMLKQVSPAGCP